MGRRVSLAALAGEAVLDPTGTGLPQTPATVPTHQVATNPVNPRQNFGDLGDLESMRTVGQLQPCVVVTRPAFLSAYPERAPAIGEALYVVVAGSRRREAADRFGLHTLDVKVMDHLAGTRSRFFAASVAENIDRKNFDALEEARAVEHLAQESGSGAKAGEILGRSKGWVSQRLALLKLSPQMQDLLRLGELPVRDARRLAALPGEEQLPAWQEEHRPSSGFTAVNPEEAGEGHVTGGAAPDDQGQRSAGARPAKRDVVTFAADAAPHEIARILRKKLSPEAVTALVDAL
jgi:ParB family transcriptional regulator, chromosome partitioning protein